MRKFLSIMIILALLSPIFAEFSDIEYHWAEKTIEEWQTKEMISGYPDGSFRPDSTISRAEFVTLLNNLFGYSYEVSQFIDVDESDWYYHAVSVGKSNGYLSWYDQANFDADKSITREEVCAILYHVMYLDNHDDGVLFAFEDTFNPWSKDYIAALVTSGYLSGYPDGTFRSDATITRAESVTLLNKIMGRRINEEGVYESLIVDGNLTINSGDVTLKNSQVKGDLILAAGIGLDEVTLDQVTIYGRLLINGGGENSVTIKESHLGKIIIDCKGHPVHLILQESNYDQITQYGDTIYTGDFGQLLEIKGGATTLKGTFNEIKHESDKDLTLINTTVKKLTLDKKMKVLGSGNILLVYLNAEADIEVTVEELISEYLVFEEEELPLGPVTPPAPPAPPTPPAPPVTNSPPLMQSSPLISGSGYIGDQLIAVAGTFTDSSQLTYTYIWERGNGSFQEVATGLNYVLSEEDHMKNIRFKTIASDGSLQTTAYSNIIYIDYPSPVNILLPQIIGDLTVGQSLEVNPGEWDQTPLLFTYTWFLNEQEVSNELNYLPDQSGELYVTVNAKNAVNNESSIDSLKVNISQKKAVNLRLPVIIGQAKVNEILSIDPGQWDRVDLDYSYTWYASDNKIDLLELSKDTFLQLDRSHLNKFIKVVERVTDGNYEVHASSEFVWVTEDTNTPPVNTKAPSINGTIEIGSLITGHVGEWFDKGIISYTGYFQIGDNNYNGLSMVIPLDQYDQSIRFVALASDGAQTSQAFSKWYTIERLENLPPTNQEPPKLLGRPIQGQSLTLTSGTWQDEYDDPITYQYIFETSIDQVNYTNYYNGQILNLDKSLVNKYVRGKVIADDGKSSQVAYTTSLLIEQAVNNPPENLSPPQLQGGHEVGDRLSLTSGQWQDEALEDLAFSYTIERSINQVDYEPYKNGHELIIESSKEDYYLRGRVLADDGLHEVVAYSPSVKINKKPNSQPLMVEKPSIEGLLIEGETVSGNVGLWLDDYTEALTYSYQWQLSDDDQASNERIIGHENEVILSQGGIYVSLTITARDEEGLIASERSDYYYVDYKTNQPPQYHEAPYIIGSIKVGERISAFVGEWTDDYSSNIEINYAFELAEDASGLNAAIVTLNSPYRIMQGDVGKYIRLKVTASDELLSESVYYTGYHEVAASDGPINYQVPFIEGQVSENKTVSANDGVWEDNLTFSYAWYESLSETGDQPRLVSTSQSYHIPTSKSLNVENALYLQLQVLASNGTETTSISTTWQEISPWVIDYVALGDSISEGYVFPKIISHNHETPYVDLLDRYLEDTYEGLALYPSIESNNLSQVGDDTNDLLKRIDATYSTQAIKYDPLMVKAIEEAEIITLCIGGNNLLNAAKYGLGYDFDNIDTSKAESGRAQFQLEFPIIINRIHALNPHAQLIVMSLYNPFNDADDKTLVINEISSENINSHILVDYYFFRKKENQYIGINDIIMAPTSHYDLADVYSGFNAYSTPNGNGMEFLTYMYIGDTFFGYELRNPHPRADGQDLIKSIHAPVIQIKQ